MHDARRNSNVRKLRQGPVNLIQGLNQFETDDLSAVVVDVQRTDSRRDVDDAGKICCAKILLENVHTESQIKIELQLPVFHKEILVSVRTKGHRLSTISD